MSEQIQEISIQNAELTLVNQSDLRIVQYQLYLLQETETDLEKKKAFKNVEIALHEITNYSGTDGIASREIMQEYFPGSFSKTACEESHG